MSGGPGSWREARDQARRDLADAAAEAAAEAIQGGRGYWTLASGDDCRRLLAAYIGDRPAVLEDGSIVLVRGRRQITEALDPVEPVYEVVTWWHLEDVEPSGEECNHG